MNGPPQPESEEQLLALATKIAGRSLGELAAKLERPVPSDQKRAKGWVGRLIEASLGAPEDNVSAPDFRELGIELKTIPIDDKGRPRESTFVCRLQLLQMDRPWSETPACRKLARVLWIPVQAEPARPMAERRLGMPLLWSPSAEDTAIFAADWEDFAALVAEGWVESLCARRGRWLQVRPKAANAQTRTEGLAPDGDLIRTLPRGLYLRAGFTKALLAANFRLPT